MSNLPSLSGESLYQMLQSRVEERLEDLIPVDLPPSLRQAACYSLLGGGKRLRPILALTAVDALGGSWEATLDAACALEMVHTYSLIHDDLPAMDDDDLRRGKPTLHKVFPESHAILAGDYLLTRAFDVIASSPNLSDKQKVHLTLTLSRRSGGHGMIGGQILDLEGEGNQLSLDQVQQIHLLKTASMIQAALEMGAIAAGLKSSLLPHLSLIGQKLGLAFQIVDDVLDVTAPASQLGKSPGSDLKNQKSTYVAHLGVEGCRKLADTLLQDAVDLMNLLPLQSQSLAQLSEKLVNRRF